MYQVDDVVVYGLHGVCRITQIEPKIFAGEEHLYYTMKPVFDDRSTFLSPRKMSFPRKNCVLSFPLRKSRS